MSVRSLPRVALAAVAVALLGGATAGPASAHGPEPTPTKVSATKATAAKAKRATPEAGSAEAHADEHAATARAIARFDRLSPARKRVIRDRLLGKNAKNPTGKRTADDLATVGAWEPNRFAAPDYGVHAVLLSGGKVLLFSMGSGHGVGPGATGNIGQGPQNDGQATLWNPALGTVAAAFEEVDPPPIPLDDPLGRPESSIPRPAPLFCAGQVQLADGRVLVAGGNLEAGSPGYGLKIMFLFDPRTETWVREPDMIRARWYPTLTRLPSGRVAILGGQDEAGKSVASFELYPSGDIPVAGVDAGAPLTGLPTSEPPARRENGMYPHSLILPSGRLASSSWGAGPMSLFEPTTGRWVTRNTQQLALNGSYPTAFPRPGDQHGTTELIQAGGLTSGMFGFPNLSRSVFAIQPENETGWRAQPALNVPRRNASSVLLPDGTAIIVGGGGTDLRFSGTPPAYLPQKRVELWDPKTGNWTVGPPQVVPRGYHSIAILLEDGRVLSAGDDYTASLLDTNRADNFDAHFELYRPPYFYRGARPVIDAAPAAAGYGESLEVRATATRPIVRATLMAPGSVTHATDMNQRLLELPIRDNGDDTYSITGPSTSAAAPPGDYMLFVLNDLGVPSMASWVRIRPSFPGQGTPTLTPIPGEVLPGPPGDTGSPQPAPTTTPTTAPVESREATVARLKGFFTATTSAAVAGMKRIANKCPVPRRAARTASARRLAAKRLEQCRAKAIK